MHERLDWDSYFMNIARVVSSRATCPRRYVGAVIVRDKTILSTGYNGSIRGMPHCTEVGHMMENGHCVATIHAELNAIVQAARNGVRIDGATIYVTASPCWTCFRPWPTPGYGGSAMGGSTTTSAASTWRGAWGSPWTTSLSTRRADR